MEETQQVPGTEEFPQREFAADVTMTASPCSACADLRARIQDLEEALHSTNDSIEVYRQDRDKRKNTVALLKSRCSDLRNALFGALRANGTGEHPDQRSRFIDAGWKAYNETSQEIE